MNTTSGTDAGSRRTRPRDWFPLIVAAAGILAFANVFACPFIFDDKSTILSNPRLHHLWPPWQAVSVPTRFLVDLTFAVNRAVGGFNPADFHLTNLAIHVTAALLLYGFVRRTLLRIPGYATPATAAWLAFPVAVVWVVHPLQTESVTYVVQRAESLNGAMILGVCYAFVRSLESGRPLAWRALAWCLCLLGMGTKEMMVVTPFLVLLYDATFAAGSWRAALKERGGFHAAMIATLAAFGLLLSAGMARASDQGGLFYGHFSRWRYLLTQSEVLLHYLRLTVFPWPLCLDYKWPMVAGWREVAWQAPLVAAAAATTLYGAIRCRRWAFPAAWTLAILAPTSTVLPLPDAAFEHRMYLPLAGILVLAVAGGHALVARADPARRQAIARTSIAAVLLVAAAFAALTWRRNADYRDEETMWRDVIRTRPDNLRAYVSLSTALLAQHRPADALQVAQALLDRVPDYAGIPFEELQRRWLAAPEAVPVAEYAMAHNNTGAAYLALDRYAEAEPHFREAARALPRAPWAHSNLGKALHFQKRTTEAIAAWRTALALDPRDPQTRTFLAIALTAAGEDREAVAHYRAALQSNPEDAFIRSQLAWILATHPDASLRNGEEAVRIAEPLEKMAGGQSARALDVLAAAYAEAGRMAEAVRTAEAALALSRMPASAPDKADEVQALRHRLELYRRSKPYHMPVPKPAE